jgi:FKBP-type peptidyl-prolyl cis-trans isomerase
LGPLQSRFKTTRPAIHGSKWQLFIPPQLAHGEKVVNGIGPNAMLIFEVEVVSIEDKQQTASAAK